MSNRRSSSNDNGRNHPYLKGISEQEWIKATIKRGPLIEKGGGNKWVQIIKDNNLTYDSRWNEIR